MNKAQISGHIEETKGKIKEISGIVLDDESLELEGNVQKNIGKIRTIVGDIKHDIKKAD